MLSFRGRYFSESEFTLTAERNEKINANKITGKLFKLIFYVLIKLNIINFILNEKQNYIMQKIKIRPALKSDSKTITKLILELAEFEKLTPPGKKGRKRLIRHAFSKNPPFKILLAETDSGTAGYAFYFFTYSSFAARRTLYLEDIFISEKFRGKGIGRMFMDKLRNIAMKNKCGRMEWVVLDWNVNAIKFYEKYGAKELTEWKTFRMTFENR